MLDDEPGRSKYNRASGNLFIASRDFEFIDGAQLGMAQDGNRTQPWSVFKTLRGPKAAYTPAGLRARSHRRGTGAAGRLPLAQRDRALIGRP